MFVYSGYRSSSTWFWNKLRKYPQLCCYYEVFHETLRTLTPQTIHDYKPGGWRSRHPNSEPYFLEFASLLGEQAGVPGFPAEEFAGARYIGSDGIGGELDGDAAAYVSRLIGAAQEQGRIPVITCTRMLGRVKGLTETFEGLHVLLVRNLYHQWNSYSGQHRTGNSYFLHMLFSTLKLAPRDGFIAHLRTYFSEESLASFDTWIAEDNYDRVFCYFAALHVYLLTHARRHADLCIDVSEIARPDGKRRLEVEAELSQAIGAPISLEDVRLEIDYPAFAVQAPKECRILIDALAANACERLGCNANERAFAGRLVQELWQEFDNFSFYTNGAKEVVRNQRNIAQTAAGATRTAQAETKRLESACAEKEARIAELEARLASLDAASKAG